MKQLLPLFLFFWSIHPLFAQLQITVTAVPNSTPPDDNIHIAGNFNGWDPGSTSEILTNNGDGTYSISLSISPGLVEYKFTRGSWPTVEGNETGGFRPNRTLNYTGGIQTEAVEIVGWEDVGGGGTSTAADNVTIISNDFYMPELDRNRRIWVYLPPDYDTSEKDYPVLYMHDGQNVFDALTSFVGEWEVDETLNELATMGDYGCIVVGIDNGGALRLDEYSPWINMEYGGGDGDEYMSFIVNTLKPYIDDNYRTQPGREHTGLMGSSMGGLIAHYGAMEYQEVFSKAGVFSPSFWFSNEAYTQVETIGKQHNMRIYYLIGQSEWATGVSDMLAMYNTLLDNGFTAAEMEFVTHADGQHSEWYWAREFAAAYQWLYHNSEAVGISSPLAPSLAVYPNPADQLLNIRLAKPATAWTLELTDMAGKKWIATTIQNNTNLAIGHLSAGVYLLKAIATDGTFFNQKVIVE